MIKKYGYQDVVSVSYTSKRDKEEGVLEGDTGVVQDRTPTSYPDVFIKRLGRVVTLQSKQLIDGVIV